MVTAIHRTWTSAAFAFLPPAQSGGMLQQVATLAATALLACAEATMRGDHEAFAHARLEQRDHAVDRRLRDGDCATQ